MVAIDQGSANKNNFTVKDDVLFGKMESFESKYSGIGDLLLESFNAKPNCLGQVDGRTGKEETLREMRDRVLKCALWLKKQGIQAGDVISICVYNTLESYAPCVAANMIAAIFNSWDPNLNTNSARHFLKVAQPKIIFAHEGVIQMIEEATKIENYNLKIIVMGGEYPGLDSFEKILENESAGENLDEFRCTPVNDSRSAAGILFSSGTTGMPKGTQISHLALFHHVESKDGLNLTNETPLWFSSVYWITGILLIYQSIVTATKRIAYPVFDEEITCKLIDKYKVTWLFVGTSMANRLLKSGMLNKYNLSSLNTVFVGGAILQRESHIGLKQALPHTKILQGYGMTEVGGIITAQKTCHNPGSCGTVFKNVSLKVVDVSTGKVVGPDQIGEIQVKTITMTPGYYNNPQATKEAIDNEGWLHTGDLGYYDKHGELYIVDRLKELIKYRGYQVSPVEIEAVLQSHRSVKEAAVVGLPHPTDDEHPLAFVSRIQGATVAEKELKDLVAARLSDTNQLRGGVRFLDNLPHTPSGKISRKELKIIAKNLAVR